MKTRISGNTAEEVIKSLPFEGYIFTNTIGFAGGIWLLWNTSVVQVEAIFYIAEDSCLDAGLVSIFLLDSYYYIC